MFSDKIYSISRELPVPAYHKVGKWSWNSYAPYLMIDFKQALGEGKDVEGMQEIVTAVSRYKQDGNKEALADVLYQMMYNAPQIKGYAYEAESIAGRDSCSGNDCGSGTGDRPGSL